MNANTARLLRDARAYGYEIRWIDPEAAPSVRINMYPKPTRPFTPELVWDYREGEGYLIQTTAYGAMSPREVSDVIEGLRRARLMVEALREATATPLDHYIHPDILASQDM